MTDPQPDPPQSGRAFPPEKGLGDERRAYWDWRKSLGLTGEAPGVGGSEAKILFAGLAALGCVVALVNVLDVLSMLHNQPQFGIWQPILWEGTGGITVLPAALIPWLLLKYVPPDDRPIWQTILIYAAAVPLFSVVHVSSFVALRMFAYWLVEALHVWTGDPKFRI